MLSNCYGPETLGLIYKIIAYRVFLLFLVFFLKCGIFALILYNAYKLQKIGVSIVYRRVTIDTTWSYVSAVFV